MYVVKIEGIFTWQESKKENTISENIWTYCEVRGRYKNKMQNWLSFLLSFHSSMAKMVHLLKVKIVQKTREHQRCLLDCTSKGSCHKNLHWKCFSYNIHPDLDIIHYWVWNIRFSSTYIWTLGIRYRGIQYNFCWEIKILTQKHVHGNIQRFKFENKCWNKFSAPHC